MSNVKIIKCVKFCFRNYIRHKNYTMDQIENFSIIKRNNQDSRHELGKEELISCRICYDGIYVFICLINYNCKKKPHELIQKLKILCTYCRKFRLLSTNK